MPAIKLPHIDLIWQQLIGSWGEIRMTINHFTFRFFAVAALATFTSQLNAEEQVAQRGTNYLSAGKSTEATSQTALASYGNVTEEIKGEAVYALTINKIPFRRTLTFNSINGGVKSAQTAKVATPIEESERSTSWLFDPQFSPNGKKLIFKWGDPFERRVGYQLYVLDLQSKKISSITNLVYQFSSWSPDSSHIAYIRNADADGYPEPGETLQLYAYDLLTKKESKVAENDGIRNSVSWTPQNTLLYSIFTDDKEKTLEKQRLFRPDCYESDAQGIRSKLIIKNGYRPTCSPDGKWICLFGISDSTPYLPLTNFWWDTPKRTELCIVTRDGSERKVLQSNYNSYSSVVWRPNSRSFVTLKTTSRGASAEGRIRKWDLDTTQFKDVVTLNASDVDPISREDTFPFFRLLEITPDGRFLPVITKEFGAATGVLYERLESLQFVDLENGTVYHSLSLKNAFGLDWRHN